MLTVAVMADLSGLTEILSTAAADCELSDRPSTSVKISDTGTQGQTHADVHINVQHSLTESVNNASSKKHSQYTYTNTVYSFPFHNSSFPGDSDNDVLPYPTSVSYTHLTLPTKRIV